jgi:hypothetical protein
MPPPESYYREINVLFILFGVPPPEYYYRGIFILVRPSVATTGFVAGLSARGSCTEVEIVADLMAHELAGIEKSKD